MVKIVLIGAAHHDIQGKQYLERALGKENPDVISIEAGPKTYRYIKSEKFARQMQEMTNLAERRVTFRHNRELLNTMCYEVLVVHEYAKAHNIPVHPIDPYRDSYLYKTFKKDYQGLSIQQLEQLVVAISSMEPDEGELMLYRIWFNYEGDQIPSDEQEHISTVLLHDRDFPKRRDIITERNLRNIVAGMDDDQKLVHIAGYAHLCRDSQQRTLYEKVRDLNPERRTVRSY